MVDLIQFDSIRGVDIHYARQPVAEYGTRGKGPRKVRLDQEFRDTLEVCLEDLWARCPLGRAEVLVSGGCYVEKAGRHGEGRAIDIDAIWWEGGKRLVTRDAPEDAVRYLGVEAVLRLHFGTVLGFWYNSAHEDHWHVDDGMPVEWRPKSRAMAVFAQAALTYVFGTPVEIDGIAGPKTLAGMIAAQYSPGVLWPMFLEGVARRAFAPEVWA